MTPEETYQQWRGSLKQPDDSIFYYHKDLDRIMLGLPIFVIASKPLVGKLGKAEMMQILHRQVPELITYWIDGEGEYFEPLFDIVMTVSEAYAMAAKGAEQQFPSHKRAIRTMALLFCHGCGIGGDMTDELAEELLDDIETDGKQIYSDKIETFGRKLMFLTQKYGFDIPFYEFRRLGSGQ